MSQDNRNVLIDDDEGGPAERCRRTAAENARRRRAIETPQEAQQRRARNAQRMRTVRANENEQQSQQHRQVELERARDRRANENEQQTQERRQVELERAIDRLANENEGQQHKRRNINAQIQRNKRANENIEQGRQRRQANVERNRNIRGNENEHMKQVEQEEQNRAIAENRPVSRITMVMREGHDQRRGNVPLHEEVAAIFTGEDGAPPAGKNIVVYPRNHHLQSIPSTSSVVDPYIYPLLFPRGDLGWDMNMPHGLPEPCTSYNYLDAMAVVSKHGKPDAFLTFTCNPRWREVTENLLPNQKAHGRPDLLTRVFRMKLFAMKKEIMQDGILGMVVARVDVIEFQKRGLPNAHILIHFAAEFKLRNADDIDRLICAQLPDPETEPELYEIIKSNMIHGPCGALNDRSPCMIDGSCSKGFPKSFNDETVMNVDGYPSYHIPDNGRTVRVRNLDIDNRWVVPYCPYLCKKYNAHINLEACVSIKAVKYLYKYIYKGHDTAHIEIAERIDHDEIRTFLDARYVSAPEACWRLFAFPMHT
ncbi:uncharacterized protein [Clytia hemisphaerica]|uniref:uncharacterized protein n=1 Tax=Clytia hemisphaerica TaxID=252671 RepID=UPI0034D4D7A9